LWIYLRWIPFKFGCAARRGDTRRFKVTRGDSRRCVRVHHFCLYLSICSRALIDLMMFASVFEATPHQIWLCCFKWRHEAIF
jgi:hypothetical protein